LPDKVRGERVAALVAFREELAWEELIAWCWWNLTGYGCPGRIHFVKKIPKTPAGKIVEAKLRKRYA
jgi:long-chain acyl-CoA synthetase